MNNEHQHRDARLDGGRPSPVVSSIWSQFTNAATNHADDIAIISRDQPNDTLTSIVGKSTADCPNGISWTYAQLLRGAITIGTLLRQQNVQPHSVLLAFLPSVCAEWSLLWWAANYLRLTLVTIDKRALEPARVDELEFYLRSLRPETVVVHDDGGIEGVDKICEELQLHVKSRLTLATANGAEGWAGLADLDPAVDVYDPCSTLHEVQADPTRIATILFTSGTSTGQPKGCPLTENNLLTSWHNGNLLRSSDNTNSRIAMTFANSRAVNQAMSNQCWIQGGTIIYITAGFSPEALLQTIEGEGVNDVILVPPQFHTLVSHPDFSDERVRSVRRVFIGGDVLPDDLKTATLKHFPNAKPTPVYGMTEGVGFIGWSSHPNGPPSPIPTHNNLLTSGTILPGTTLKITEAGKLLKRSEIGEIHIKSPVTISEYRDGMSTESFYGDEEGRWFITGDLGCVDENGFVYVLGRKKDVMKRVGIPVPPVLLENILSTYAGVQASVFGLPDLKLGEEPVAVVSDIPDNISKEDLKQIVLDHLGPDYALGKVFTLKELGMQEFPINVTGKIMKIELRRAAMELRRAVMDLLDA